MPRTPRRQERAKVWATKYECKYLILEIYHHVPEFFFVPKTQNTNRLVTGKSEGVQHWETCICFHCSECNGHMLFSSHN